MVINYQRVKTLVKIFLYLSWCFSWGSCISWVFSWFFTWILILDWMTLWFLNLAWILILDLSFWHHQNKLGSFASILHTFYFHRSHVMFIHAWSLHFPLQKQNKKKQKRNKQKQKKVTMKNKVYTTFLVTCVGYHDDSYKQTMLGLYTYFS